jgi:hypothetical protein
MRNAPFLTWLSRRIERNANRFAASKPRNIWTIQWLRPTKIVLQNFPIGLGLLYLILGPVLPLIWKDICPPVYGLFFAAVWTIAGSIGIPYLVRLWSLHRISNGRSKELDELGEARVRVPHDVRMALAELYSVDLKCIEQVDAASQIAKLSLWCDPTTEEFCEMIRRLSGGTRYNRLAEHGLTPSKTIDELIGKVESSVNSTP